MIKAQINKVLLGTLVGLIGVSWLAIREIGILRGRTKELTAVIQHSNDTAQFYKNQYGKQVATIEALELSVRTMRDLKDQLAPLTSQFEGINKRMTNLEMLANATFKATKKFDLQAKDSIIYLADSTRVTVWAFSEKDPHFSLDGYVVPEFKRVVATPSFNADFTAALISKRKKVLGIRIGRKVERFELTSTNPYIQITDIKFYKKKE